jgi:hypothetical protein
MMTNDTYFSVSVAALSWTLQPAGPTAKAAQSASAERAIKPRRHLGAAATVASVNRGTF